MSTKLAEMWAALEAHKPAPEYAEAWATMCRERTSAAAWAAYRAAPELPFGLWASAAWDAAWALGATDAAKADRYAQQAIDAIKEVKP